MLKVKSYEKGDVVSVKLVTGEELVTKLGEITESSYEFTKPLSLNMSAQGPVLAPYMLTIELDASITIDKSKIIAIVKPREDVRSQFIQSTTGLSIPEGVL